ncbi:MAG: DoxX family protein [Longimicrobiales bacterium]
MSDDNRGGFNEFALNALRIVAAFLFMHHGAQKLFGVLGGTQVEALFSQRGLAGVLEFGGGILLMVGLLTRPVAFILSGQMAVAYFIAHFPREFWPIQNGGELAALYSFLWLFFCFNGAGAFSLDAFIRSRREQQPITEG